jgi:hypothetical protein
MRGFIKFIFGFIFVVSAFLAVFLFSLKTTIFTYSNIEARLVKYDIYQRTYDAIPEIAKLVTSGAESPKGVDNYLTAVQLSDVVTDAITPAYLEQKSTFFLSGFYGWLYGKGSGIPAISLIDIKPKMEQYAALQMNVPVEFIRSELSGFKVPETIQVQPIPPLLVLRGALSNFSLYMVILVLCALASLGVVIATGCDGMSCYIKRPVGPLWGAGILTALFGGFIWIFFNAGNLLSKLLAERFESAPKVMTLAYDFVNSILSDFVKLMLLSAGIFIIIAFAIDISSKFIKKGEVKKFQEGQEKK